MADRVAEGALAVARLLRRWPSMRTRITIIVSLTIISTVFGLLSWLAPEGPLSAALAAISGISALFWLFIGFIELAEAMSGSTRPLDEEDRDAMTTPRLSQNARRDDHRHAEDLGSPIQQGGGPVSRSNRRRAA